jgi:hypothetical protein
MLKKPATSLNTPLRMALLVALALTGCQAENDTSSTAALASDSGSATSLVREGINAATNWVSIDRSTIVNTTFNTYYKDKEWTATMGPLHKGFGGIACDNKGKSEGYTNKYRDGAAALWFVAPSDALWQFGMKYCSPNPHGGEPSCSENWSLCGRKIRIRCKAGNPWCAKYGEANLLSQMKWGQNPQNNYIPDYYVKKTSDALGQKYNHIARSVVLMITDFCPAGHSTNKQTGQCQGPQLDIATSAFLVLSKQNAEGWINSNMQLEAQLLDNQDASALGPEY